MSIFNLLEEISLRHFPNPPASPQQLEHFERQMGWHLDPDLRAFYLHCNGADLFEKPDSPYRILPLAKIVRARIAIRGKDDDSRGPASWYALCDVQDGNYVLVDVGVQEDGRYPLLDGWHEGFPDPKYCKKIANSFSAFLEGALHSGRPLYWLED